MFHFLLRRDEGGVMTRFPFTSYPNGWYTVAWSDELRPGDVLPVRYFGKELVLFRTQEGKATLLNAHCPHLGAHLGHGGKVMGDCIRCPFHGWKFDTTGQCTEVAYASRIPPKAKIQDWPLIEKNGVILTYYHALGKAPEFEIPDLAEGHSPEWSSDARSEWKGIKSHIQELVENAVDAPHFLSVHSLAGMKIFDFEAKGHELHMHGRMQVKEGEEENQLRWRWSGISYGVVHTRGQRNFENIQQLMYTPIDEEHVHVRFTTWIKKLPSEKTTKIALEAMNAETKRLFEQDIPIWENKIYRDKPQFSEGEAQYMTFRKWARQFYSDRLAAQP